MIMNKILYVIIIIIINILIIINCIDNNNNNNDINGTPITYKGYQCQYTSNHNICCNILNLQGYYCFPKLIIAGSQKSGTTTLSALLTSLPGISFAKRKELHYFSKNANYDKGLEHYLKDFEPWFSLDKNGNRNSNSNNNSNSIDVSKSPPIYVESTPFYIASPDACKRIASDLPNTTHLILSVSYTHLTLPTKRIV